MDPVIIRAYQLKTNDKFKKQGLSYQVIRVDDTGIYYSVINHRVISKQHLQHYGTACKEMIELIERSNFNE